MQKKHPDFPFRSELKENEAGLMKMCDLHYQRFEQLFKSNFPEHQVRWDYR